MDIVTIARKAIPHTSEQARKEKENIQDIRIQDIRKPWEQLHEEGGLFFAPKVVHEARALWIERRRPEPSHTHTRTHASYPYMLQS